MRSIQVLLAVSFAAGISAAVWVGKAPGAFVPTSTWRAPSSIRGACGDLHGIVCGKRGATRDPTGSVQTDVTGELRALRTYEEILHRHPEWTSQQADEEFVRTIYTAQERARIESATRWVRNALERFIERQPAEVFDKREKKQLRNRLRRVELQLPIPASAYADEPDLLTKNDVFYERLGNGRMRLRVGGAYLLTAKSWFNLVFTLAHEFAHAIDPCEIRSSNHLSFPAYDRISACFASNGLVTLRNNRHECGRNDQLSETFSDWMAVQISAEALQSFAAEYGEKDLLNAAINSVRDLCEHEDDPYEQDTELHPSSKTRIERIFGWNPRIREVLGCGPLSDQSWKYCGFQD